MCFEVEHALANWTLWLLRGFHVFRERIDGESVDGEWELGHKI
jgi:hypothetical protein